MGRTYFEVVRSISSDPKVLKIVADAEKRLNEDGDVLSAVDRAAPDVRSR